MAEYYHPTIEKTFSLEDLSVPPKNYAGFLNQCIEKFVSFILGKSKSKTIEEAQEKYKKVLKKLNPNTSEDELPQLPFVYPFMISDLEFLKVTKETKRKKLVSVNKHERIFEVNFDELIEIVNVNGNKKAINKYIEDFREILDKRYPNRKSKMPFSDTNPSIPYGFELNLSLMSTSTLLESKIALCDHGIRGDGYCIPGIKIISKLPYGSLDITKKMTDKLEEVVNSYYPSHRTGIGISHVTSYTED